MVLGEQAVSTDAVRGELARILASPTSGASERNRQFLACVVGERLVGRGERIKARITASVFGRDPKSDPQFDSVVRIEAGRVRRSLERCYLTDGRAGRLRIDIPRGGHDDEAANAVAAIRGLVPDYGAHAAADLPSPQLVAGLGKAGLAVTG